MCQWRHHPDEARKVAIAKQVALREAGKTGGRVLTTLHRLYGALAGYGYRPMRTFAWMAVVWLFCAVWYGIADYRGKFGPTSAVIVSNATIAEDCGKPMTFRETTWTQCASLPQVYTTFSPWLYSLDLILPLVDLQQESDWAPMVMKDDGRTPIWSTTITRWVMWFEILFGWAMSLLLMAVLGNLVKKD